jgi:DNA-binding NarL/FixJ family response regulator
MEKNLLPTVRVLVVDDFEPWLRFTCSVLRKNPELQIVGEVSDGLEAVQKAEELQPDLILLDIGLPTLNGFEAARRIRRLSPGSKILFVSQELSVDMVKEAFSLGALGYIVKASAGGELLAAVEAVCQGRQFIGSSLADNKFGDSPALANKGSKHNHVVQFYRDDSSWRDNISGLVCTALSKGQSLIVCATKAHLDGLHGSLQAHNIDVHGFAKVGRYIALDSTDTLSKFMDADLPNQRKFALLLGSVIREADAAAVTKNNRVAIVGEMVAVLWAEKKYDATIKLEQLWNELARTHSFDLHCAYPASGFQEEQMDQAYATICAQHSAIIPA